MGGRADRSDPTDRDSTERSRSIGYDLLVWALVAPPFGFLGVTLIDAIVASGPVSRTGALVLVGGIAVVGSALLSDFRPSILAAITFLILDQFLVSFLYLTALTVIFAGSTLSPGQEVGLQALAIAVAAAVAFTTIGRGNETVGRIVGRLLRLPPRDQSDARSSGGSTGPDERG